MVFESLTNPELAEHQPWKIFFLGVIYSSVAVMLALWVFRSHVSLVMIFLTVLASVHLMYSTIKYEENKDLEIDDERTLLKEHGKALLIFMFMFLGFTVSFSLWYILTPPDMSAHLFETQLTTINQINGAATGSVIETTSLFKSIFFNNIKVMFFCLLFAFFYGVGAIFILAWNASVIAAAMGMFVKSLTGNVFSLYALSMMRYFTHGLLEMLAYFMAGLGGGIIAIAIINHDFADEKFKRIFIDSLDLILGAFFVLFVAALIEVFVTPSLVAW